MQWCIEKAFTESPAGSATSATPGRFAAVVDAAGGPEAAPVMRRWTGNLLHLPPEQIEQAGGGRIIVNSGSLADDLDALDPRNWMALGEAALLAHLDRLDAALREIGVTLLLEPCSRHILHDAQVVHSFFRERLDEAVGLALNPAALIEPSMLPLVDDHLQRIAESIAPLASVLILEDRRPDERGERMAACAHGDGRFESRGMLELMIGHLQSDTIVIARGPGSSEVAGALAASMLAPQPDSPGR